MENTFKDQPALPQSLLGSYFHFLRMPDLAEAPRNLGVRRTLRQILRLYTPHLLAILLIGLVISQVVVEGDNLLLEDVSSKQEIWGGLFLIVVLAPIVEEIICRLPLRSAIFSFSIPISVLISCFLSILSVDPAISSATVLALLGLNIYFAIKRPKISQLQRLYTRFSRSLFYLSAISFGAIHISNYDSRVWMLMPLLVLPQFVLGLFFGFVRIRYGLRWAMFTHAFHNGCMVGPFLIVLGLGSPERLSELEKSIDLESLNLLEKLLAMGLGLYVIGGLLLCLITAWKLIREWRHGSRNLIRR